MGTITFKNKRDVGAGNFEYTYECFCAPRPAKDVVLTAGNDNEAKQLAQQECDEYCSGREQLRPTS